MIFMDDFRKRMQRRQIILVCGLLGACCAILLSRHYEKAPSASEFLRGFAEGFQTGIIAVTLLLPAFFIFRNTFAMRDPERLKRLYISETDERKLMIMQKSGSDGMNVIMYGLAVGAAVAGNFNDTVFFTLLGACLFVTLVRGIMKLYYNLKY